MTRSLNSEQLQRWARLNGFARTESDFSLAELAAGRVQPSLRGRHREEGFRWPWRDHYAHFKIARTPVAILTQPYGDFERDGGDLRALVQRHGLRIQMPPKPKASLHRPGHAYFIVITTPLFGEVCWLDEQLAAREER